MECGAAVAQVTVNHLVAGSNPATPAISHYKYPMNFLIIGDSWGCGEWSKEFIYADTAPDCSWHPYGDEPRKYCKTQPIPDTHVGVYLEGHTFTNLCIGGDSNHNASKICDNHLKTKHDYDYIIWFQTEPVRDIIFNNAQIDSAKLLDYNGYDAVHDDLWLQTYTRFATIHDQYRIPFIVIGGMAVVNPIINKFNFAKIILNDWANELIFDTPIKHPHLIAHLSKFAEKYEADFNRDKFIAEAEASTNWIHYCYHHTNFPDWGHPDRRAHQHLAQWILKQLKR